MIPGEPPRTRNYVSNTAEMRSHFSILVNVLLMSILCDFHEDKTYFKEEIILGNRIKEIKNIYLTRFSAKQEWVPVTISNML